MFFQESFFFNSYTGNRRFCKIKSIAVFFFFSVVLTLLRKLLLRASVLLRRNCESFPSKEAVFSDLFCVRRPAIFIHINPANNPRVITRGDVCLASISKPWLAALRAVGKCF